jgi:hypothetical protein
MNFAKLSTLVIGVGLVSAHVSGVYATKTRVMAEQKELSFEEKMLWRESHKICAEEGLSSFKWATGRIVKWTAGKTEGINVRNVHVLCMKKNGG